MSTPSTGSLGFYLRKALRSPASAELLKLVADALATLLGTASLGNTAAELVAALDALPDMDPSLEPLERNARFAAAEFGLSDLELNILLLALRMRRERQMSRFCGAVHTRLGDASRTIAAVLDRDLDEVQPCLAPGSRLCSCGPILFEDDDLYGSGVASVLAVSRPAVNAMLASHASCDAWRAALVGHACEANLPWSCFDHLGPVASLAVRVLVAAASAGEAGIHIMLAGPPGTGKTEFARALASRAGLALYAVGKEGSDGNEPSRPARSMALRLSLAC